MKRFLIAVVLVLGTVPAWAQTFCVGSDQELQSRLFQAHGIAVANPGGSDVQIRLRRRATPYNLTTTPDSGFGGFHFGKLQLLGGYSESLLDACTPQGRNLNPDNTKINVSTALEIGADADVTIQGLTFTAPGNDGLILTKFGNQPVTFTLDSNVFDGGNPDGVLMGPDQFVDPEVNYRVVNNLFTGSQQCGLEIEVNKLGGGQGGSAEIANNTFAANVINAICLTRLSSVRLDNNIAWGDTIVDRDPANPTPVTLYYNTTSSYVLPGLVGAPIGELNVDPKFQAGTFRPATNSPMVNSGAPGSVPGGLPELDLDGNPRIVGSRVDRGAYESPAGQDTDTIIVNTAIDTLDASNGKMSLRNALALANADPGTETIVFAIGEPRLCEARIVLDPALGVLPPITGSLVIDGYSQGPATPNTLVHGFNANICVALVGNGALDGLAVPTNSSATVVVKGLRFAGFEDAVDLSGGSGHSLSGNSFDPGLDAGNVTNIRVAGAASNVFVGGYVAEQRNLISGAIVAGVELMTSSNHVDGNHIGPKVDGLVDPQSRNLVGVRVTGTGNTIGYNDVIGNVAAGIKLAAGNNLVAGNQVSVNGVGIEISGSDNTVNGNEVSYNFGYGVGIVSGGYKNRVFQNRIHDNQGLGIDINADGLVNANNTDVGFASTLGNRGQNFPELLLAQNLAGTPLTTAAVLGELYSANGTFDLRFYASDTCDMSGHGEGQEPVGQATVTISDAGLFTNGSQGFATQLSSPRPLSGRMLTATATDATGNTSEFSACKLIDVRVFRDGFE